MVPAVISTLSSFEPAVAVLIEAGKNFLPGILGHPLQPLVGNKLPVTHPAVTIGIEALEESGGTLELLGRDLPVSVRVHLGPVEPTSAAFVKIPPPTRANSAIDEAPKLKPRTYSRPDALKSGA